MRLTALKTAIPVGLRGAVVKSGLVFLLGLVLTTLATVWQVRHNTDKAANRFDEMVTNTLAEVRDRLGDYQYGLRGTRGAALAAGFDRLDRQHFQQYAASRDVDKEFPGARGFGLIRRVAQADEAAFVTAAQQDGWPDFAVRQFAAHEGSHYVIQYLEPIARNRAGIGMDVASETSRKAAADQAMRTGMATLTGPIRLAQDANKALSSFLLLLPIYRPGADVASPEQREAALEGWSFAPLMIDEILRNVNLHRDQLAFSLSDVSEEGAQLFYRSPSMEHTADGLSRRVPISIYGRTWEANVKVLPMFFQQMDSLAPHWVAVVGLVISALLSALLGIRQKELEQTNLVRLERARRASMVDYSADAIVGEGLDGRITDWNPAAERLFGYTAVQAIHRPLAELLLPTGRAQEDAGILSRITHGDVLPPFDTTRMHQHGNMLDVSITAAPMLDSHGRCIGIVKTIRDIGPTKRAELRVHELNVSLEQQVLERTALLEIARHDLQLILDAVPSQIGYWDRSLINRMANEAYREWFGIDPAKLLGKHMRDLLGPELYELSRPRLEAALAGQAQSFFEKEIPRPAGGGKRHALVNYLPDIVDGEVRGLFTLVHDVSELVDGRIKLGALQRENDALLRTIHLHALVSIADRSGRITEVNDAFCRISGYSSEELIGQNHRMVNSGVQDRAFWVEMWKTISSGQSWRGEICNRAKDGSLYWVASTIAPLLNSDGHVERYISVRTDITASKLAEQALQVSQAFQDRANRVAKVGAWQVDLDTMRVTWSPQLKLIHEVPPDFQPQIASSLDFYLPAGRVVIQNAVEQGIATGQSWDVEAQMQTAQGRVIWVRVLGEAELKGGHPVRLVGILQDITARKQTEQTLSYERHLMTSLLKTVPDQIYFKDAQSRFLRINPGLAKRYGLQDPENAIGLSDADFFTLEHAKITAAVEHQIMETGMPVVDLEEQEIWPDRPPTWNLTTKMPLRDTDGRVIGTFGISRDITARKKTEEELHHANLRLVETSSLLQNVLESASEVSIIATDANLGIRVFNAGAERLLGYSSNEIVGRETPMLIHDPEEVSERGRELTTLLGRPVLGAAVFTDPATLHQPHEWAYVRKDGSRVTVSLVVTAMHAADGSIFGYLGVAHDITRQKQVEHTLREAMAKARLASVAKSQFLANMSHEIRTPMNAVLGLSYLLEHTALDDEQAALLQKIKFAGQSLLALINDVLDFSKIEANEMAIEQAPFDLHTLLRNVSDLMVMPAQAKGLNFLLDSPADLPDMVVGDTNRMQQILINLLSNAIKFTMHGDVRLTLQLLQSDAERIRLRFSVRDSGIGIPPVVQARLFTPFVQADTSTTRRFGGTGLGLSIVKQLVTLMGGQLGLESVEGEGSEFWVELDFVRATVGAKKAYKRSDAVATSHGLRGLRVLVVDDSEINLEVAKRILALEGAQVTLAANGRDAIEILRARPVVVDVVLMDIQMPELDGLSATRIIRRELGLTALPVIALTAGAMLEEHNDAQAAGMDDFVAKPFEVQHLVRTILRHLPNVDAGVPTLIEPPLAEKQPERTDWPVIQGIDTQDANMRLGGDWVLFYAMLKRLLREFHDIGKASTVGDTASLATLAQRMHKLRGSAGMLGVNTVQQLAAEAEQACKEGLVQKIQQLLRKLDLQMHTLLQSARPYLDSYDKSMDAVLAVPSTPLSSEDLTGLCELLRQQNMLAIVRFEELAAQIKPLLGAEQFARLRDDVDNLQFNHAAQALVALRA